MEPGGGGGGDVLSSDRCPERERQTERERE